MNNSKSNPILQRIKDSLLHQEPQLLKAPTPLSSTLASGGFEQLHKLLEAARPDMDFARCAVYIDDESAEVLDLLRKKAKIKSNVLVSCLLHEFFAQHKELIRQLVEKRNNRLID